MLRFDVNNTTWTQALSELEEALPLLPPQCDALKKLLQSMAIVQPKPVEKVSDVLCPLPIIC
jgi:hypothetical protein